ncbi:tetracycline-efflux transporter protein [Rutstroemia sp. NJR-2017a WRK4]|nr:tetracycline-efflux transporter protein [Rutstroemia sp. NJR-2017a WRK4]
MDDGSAGQGRDEGGQKYWGAREALRNHTKGYKSRTTSEVSPLLGNDATSSRTGDGGSEEPVWEGHADFEGLTWWHKPSVYWLLVPFFLFALAFGGIVVPKLNLILALVCRSYLAERSAQDPTFLFTPVILGSDNPQCRIPEVQSLVTKFVMYITVITGILSAIMAPKLGAWSDRYGRTRLLVITSLGGLLTEIITILAGKVPDMVPYQWLLAGAVFDGLCGSFTAGMALTHAYAADCTPPSKRAVSFAYFHACLFGGIAIGPLMAAAILKLSDDLVLVFYVALGIHAFFIAFLVFIVPESLTQKRQVRAREKYALETQGQTWLQALTRTNPLAPLKILWPSKREASTHVRTNLLLLATVDTIIFGVAIGAMTVVIYYSGFQFGWDTADTAFYISTVNIARVFALVGLLPLFNYLMRTRPRARQRRESGVALPLERNVGADSIDLAVIRVSVLLEIAGFLGFTLARQGYLFVCAGVLASMGGVGSPTLQSALTKHVPRDHVGQLLGATGLLHALARVVCPLVFNLIYALTVGTFRQTVFVVLTGCFGLAFTLSWFIRPNVSIEDPNEDRPQSREIGNDPDVLVDEEVVGL